MKNQPLFIIGCPRGGTTLLRLMLNMHSQIAIPAESHFLIPILKKFDPEATLNKNDAEGVIRIISDHPRFQDWNIEANDLNNLVMNLNFPIKLSNLISQVFFIQISDSGKPIWGDKTPEYFSIVPKLSRLFPKAKMIGYTRDGRDVSISLKKTGWHAWNEFQRGKYWANSVKKTFSLKSNKNTMFLKYEDLIVDTELTLKKLCKFLGISYESQMLDYDLSYKKNIAAFEQKAEIHTKLARKSTKNDIARWKTESSAFTVWVFEAAAYKSLKKAGYDLAYYKPYNVFHIIGNGLYSIWGYTVILSRWFYLLPIHRPLKDLVKKIIRKNK